MSKKKATWKFIPFDDSKYYDIDQSEYDDDIENKGLDELYRRYSERNYPEAILDKYLFERFVKELLEFKQIKRKLTRDESLYVLELGRAIDPKPAHEYLNDIRYDDGHREKLKFFRDLSSNNIDRNKRKKK